MGGGNGEGEGTDIQTEVYEEKQRCGGSKQ